MQILTLRSRAARGLAYAAKASRHAYLIIAPFLLLVLIADSARAQSPDAAATDDTARRGVSVDPQGWKVALDDTSQHLRSTMTDYRDVLVSIHGAAKNINELAEALRAGESKEGRTQARLAAKRAVEKIQLRTQTLIDSSRTFDTTLGSNCELAADTAARLKVDLQALMANRSVISKEAQAFHAESRSSFVRANEDGELSLDERSELHKLYRQESDAAHRLDVADLDVRERQEEIERKEAERAVLLSQRAHAFDLIVEAQKVDVRLRRALAKLRDEMSRDDLEDATREIAELAGSVRRIPNGLDSIDDALGQLRAASPTPPRVIQPVTSVGFDSWLRSFDGASTSLAGGGQ